MASARTAKSYAATEVAMADSAPSAGRLTRSATSNCGGSAIPQLNKHSECAIIHGLAQARSFRVAVTWSAMMVQ